MLSSEPVPGAAQSSKTFFRVPSSRQRLMRTESRRKIASARAAACKPQDAIEMRANILLRATGMRDLDKRPDQFPFLIGKFITTGFHAWHFFLPLSYHLFVSFSCTLRYFLLFRYILGKTEKTKDDDANDLPKTSGNSGTIIVDATCVPSNIRFP